MVPYLKRIGSVWKRRKRQPSGTPGGRSSPYLKKNEGFKTEPIYEWRDTITRVGGKMAEADEWLANAINSLIQRVEALEKRVAALELGASGERAGLESGGQRLGEEWVEGTKEPARDKFVKALRSAPAPEKKSR